MAKKLIEAEAIEKLLECAICLEQFKNLSRCGTRQAQGCVFTE